MVLEFWDSEFRGVTLLFQSDILEPNGSITCSLPLRIDNFLAIRLGTVQLATRIILRRSFFYFQLS